MLGMFILFIIPYAVYARVGLFLLLQFFCILLKNQEYLPKFIKTQLYEKVHY
jgi:hypothetical protein